MVRGQKPAEDGSSSSGGRTSGFGSHCPRKMHVRERSRCVQMDLTARFSKAALSLPRDLERNQH